MKILLTTDGSDFSNCAIEEVLRRKFPPGSEVKVVSVAQATIPMISDPTMTGLAMHDQSLQNAREQAAVALESAMRQLQVHSSNWQLSEEMLEGFPKEEILAKAESWGADLIIVGSKGRGAIGRFLLGSVSHAVALHAPCSVEIVRCPREVSKSE